VGKAENVLRDFYTQSIRSGSGLQAMATIDWEASWHNIRKTTFEF
jgi:hypothetical protein